MGPASGWLSESMRKGLYGSVMVGYIRVGQEREKEMLILANCHIRDSVENYLFPNHFVYNKSRNSLYTLP